MKKVVLFLSVVLFGVLGVVVYQEGASESEELTTVPRPDESGHVTFSLDAQYEALELGGESLFVLTFEMDPGWHIYGKEPGRFGFPTTFLLESGEKRWRSIAGPEEVAVRWPAPKVKVDEEGEESFLYDQPFAVVIGPISLEKGGATTDGHLPIRVEARWLECSQELCIPKKVEKREHFPVGDHGAQPPVETSEYRRALLQW